MGGSYTKFEPILINKTGLKWTLGEASILQGKWNKEPPEKIATGDEPTEATFRAYSQEDCVCNSAGKVVYSMAEGTTVIVSWLINYGSAGSASFSMRPQGNNAGSWETVVDNEGQQSGGAYSTYKPKFTLRPATTPSA